MRPKTAVLALTWRSPCLAARGTFQSEVQCVIFFFRTGAFDGLAPRCRIGQFICSCRGTGIPLPGPSRGWNRVWNLLDAILCGTPGDLLWVYSDCGSNEPILAQDPRSGAGRWPCSKCVPNGPKRASGNRNGRFWLEIQAAPQYMGQRTNGSVPIRQYSIGQYRGTRRRPRACLRPSPL